MKGMRHVAMDQASDGTTGSAGGGGAAPGAQAPAQGTGAAAGGQGAGAAPAPASVLDAGKDAAAAPQDATSWLTQFPQFAVNGADGKPDIAASAAKLAGSYGELAKRMKDAGSPPKEPKDYVVNVPDALKGKYDPAGDKLLEQFLTKAHAAGLTQKQLDFVLGEYAAIVPQLAGAGRALSKEEGEKALREVWKTDAEFRAGLASAYRVVEAFGGDRKDKLVERYGNDPDLVAFLAEIGKELREDTQPVIDGLAAGTQYASMTREQLLVSDAYKDPKHPDHERVSKLVRALYEKQYGTAPAI